MIFDLDGVRRHPRPGVAPRSGRSAVSAVGAATVILMTAAILAGCASPGVAEAVPTLTSAPTPTAPTPAAAPTAATEKPSAPAPPSPLEQGLPPVAVSIDAISLDEPLIDLGLTAEGGMQVPADFDEVGWFTGGGRPGGFGPLIIAAHVDSPTGPAVFIRLRELTKGDLVVVTDSADGVHRYRVTEVADYPKAEFPTTRVFGAVPGDELRLITCGGVFDSTAGSYEDNRVVYAVRE